jgi:RNA polymerase sigma factor (sigma-70 family)
MAALVKNSGRISPARLAGSAILACQSDDRLVALTRSGHERAFEAIVDRYSGPLLRFCRGILPESRAEDAVQQSFINAHAALTESDDAVQLKPWLFTVARNASLNMLRQNGWNYDEIPLDFDGVRRPDQVVEERAELEQTVIAMNQLPDRQRSALVMRELEGRSYKEIGRALGANDGAVRQLLNRARVALRTAATAVMPPPLVERLAAAPPDGRRVGEIAAGLGAAGVAKAGATALVAGTLVVGALNAPLPAGSGNTTRQKATLSDSAPAKKAAAPATQATPIAFRSGPARPPAAAKHRSPARQVASSAPATAVVKHTTQRSESGQSGAGEDTGSHHQSGSGDDGHSGSGDTGNSGSDDSRERSSGSSGSGSGDQVSSEADSSPERSGSDGSGTSGPSGDLPSLTESGTSGSGTSGGGSPDGGGSDGSPEPDDPPAATP